MLKRFTSKRSNDPDTVPPGILDAAGQESLAGEDGTVTDEVSARDALEDQVRERDANLSDLQKKRSEKEKELDGLKKELEAEKLKQMQNEILHQLEKDRLERQTRAMEERLEALERDMQDKEAIQEYANLIKSVAPENGVDSQYVMKLQAQLAKAVKKMDATTHQMALVEESCNEVLESLKTEITEVVEERCRNEFELRKQLELLKEQKEDMQSNYETQIRKNQEELERLRLRASGEAADDIQEQMEETESRLMELRRINADQDFTIQQLNETLENIERNHSSDNENNGEAKMNGTASADDAERENGD
mmetsp:Transcript_26087/g.36555  ORF Transcript_26087/g.36555 Transcript_26087/m.36555 type:complete len:308 (+) Transcript_26087:243-1166(+)